MAIQLFLVLALAVGCQFASGGQLRAALTDGLERIINGDEAAPNQFPYAAYISYPGITIQNIKVVQCTGSVIGPRTILTAAHCLIHLETGEKFKKENIIVHVGDVDYKQAQKFEIAESIVHPNYNNNNKNIHYDIGVIKTATDVISENVETACIASNSTRLDQDFEKTVALGWGYTDYPKEITTDFLKYLELNVLKYAQCKELNEKIAEEQLCARSKTGTLCRGDSGGALTSVREGKKDVIIGVTSYIRNNCTVDMDNPPVFTRVASYEKWIIENAGEDGENICRQ